LTIYHVRSRISFSSLSQGTPGDLALLQLGPVRFYGRINGSYAPRISVSFIRDTSPRLPPLVTAPVHFPSAKGRYCNRTRLCGQARVHIVTISTSSWASLLGFYTAQPPYADLNPFPLGRDNVIPHVCVSALGECYWGIRLTMLILTVQDFIFLPDTSGLELPQIFYPDLTLCLPVVGND
jgi:hypothetical protein